MTKYDESFKCRVVKEYLGGEGGFRLLSRKYGVGESMLRRWVSAYRAHGQTGLRKKHESYSAEFKMSVLQHMWRHELSYQHTCAVFDLREANSVSRWERQYHEGGFEALMPRRKGRPPRMSQPKQPSQPTSAPADGRSREDLLKENEYLRAEVAYLKKLDELLRATEQAKPKKKRKS
jgi:transposase